MHVGKSFWQQCQSHVGKLQGYNIHVRLPPRLTWNACTVNFL